MAPLFFYLIDFNFRLEYKNEDGTVTDLQYLTNEYAGKTITYAELQADDPVENPPVTEPDPEEDPDEPSNEPVTNPEDKDDNYTAIIVGSVAGGASAISITGVIIYFVTKKKKIL